MNTATAYAPFGFRRDLHRWQQLVTPAWVAGLVAGVPLVAAPANEWRLFEIGFSASDAFARGHIAGAGYIDTARFEHGPLWNKVSDAALGRLLLEHGIRHDTTVVLYGRNRLAAARAAHLMLYAGVADVRLLDGGFDAWTNAGLPLRAGRAHRYEPAADFGAMVPVHPEYLFDMPQARSLLRQADGALVSTRTWNEFVGNTSGYSYIDAKGDIAGARWGRSGDDDDVNSMTEFHHGGRMKAAAEIRRMWGAAGIHPEQHTVFYCGTGWRASLAFFYAWLMNWERIGVYDGGWCEWSRDPDNPVICRAHGADRQAFGS
ncbi:rhodanese [Massilia eurypsychrophila]|uniref:Rhodanese n=1 Tax=Massilia eurypsychrophila TaxID=1485217 RepID=A0A2G8TD57_9BURK|nr:rhodanese-like domain-containing protein [Massilia eurypsychrophila]PIL43991.1 rhodanese [Massilia eurypsychrophila]